MQTFKKYPGKKFNQIRGIAAVRKTINDGGFVISCYEVKLHICRTVLRDVSDCHSIDSANKEFKERAAKYGKLAFYAEVGEV